MGLESNEVPVQPEGSDDPTIDDFLHNAVVEGDFTEIIDRTVQITAYAQMIADHSDVYRNQAEIDKAVVDVAQNDSEVMFMKAVIETRIRRRNTASSEE